MDPYDVIIMPWITEKTLDARRIADPEGGYMENNNRIEFIVRREATKKDIKEAIETLLEVKVAKVNVRINRTGKHASIRLADGYDAEEAALKLGAFLVVRLWARGHVHSAGVRAPKIEFQATGSLLLTVCRA